MASLSHGLAIVTTSGHLTEPFWAARRAVDLVDVSDTDGLVTRSCAILDEPSLRRRLGANAKALYEELFDVERTMAALGSAGPTTPVENNSLPTHSPAGL